MKSPLYYAKILNRLMHGHQPIFLEYPVDLKPRWTEAGGNPHLSSVVERCRKTFEKNLLNMRELREVVFNIQEQRGANSIDWSNSFIPALDALSLMWAAKSAENTIIEIGSGNSTAFIRSALNFYNLKTRLISIDPHPRKDIDGLCDEVIRLPVESIDLSLFDRVKRGDVVFVDNSHRSFMNSDVTVVMLDILPRLPAGTLVGLHDIFLPFDYFQSWAPRAYNEQYLLACCLLSGETYSEIELANYWISVNRLHHEPLHEIWEQLGLPIRDRPSSAFWIRKGGQES